MHATQTQMSAQDTAFADINNFQANDSSSLVKVPMGILDPPTPSPAPSGPSMSSKTPGRDFDDRCSLGKLPDVGS